MIRIASIVSLCFSLCLIVALGATDASVYVLTAVTLYYGILMLNRGISDPGEIIFVRYAMLYGGATIGQAFQLIENFSFAISAASELFPIIDRVSSFAIFILMNTFYISIPQEFGLLTDSWPF